MKTIKKFIQVFQIVFSRDSRLGYTVKEFAHINKDLLIIVCDPKTDQMFVTYKDRFVAGKIKSALGKTTHVVRNVLKHSQFERTVNDYIVSIAETLHLPLKAGNQFYQFIDGALYNISNSFKKNKKSDGVIPSPYMKPDDSSVEKGI